MIVHISEIVYIVIYIYMLSNLLYLEDDVMPSKLDIAIFMAFLQKITRYCHLRAGLSLEVAAFSVVGILRRFRVEYAPTCCPGNSQNRGYNLDVTLGETKMTPENCWLEYYILSFGSPYFQVLS